VRIADFAIFGVFAAFAGFMENSTEPRGSISSASPKTPMTQILCQKNRPEVFHFGTTHFR
jgi:hypothetical protein